MDFRDYQHQLAQTLLTVPGSIWASNNKFIAMRCKFCGDSKRDPNKKRLYVKVDYDYGELPWFYCHNCHISGVVSEDFLNDITDGEAGDIIYSHKEYMNEVKKRGIYGKVINTRKHKIVLNLPLATKSNQLKIDYIENRLGIKKTRDSKFKYKIIFNIKDYIQTNNIKEYTRDKRVIDMIDEDYIGFLSTNNEYINFRCVNDRGDDKYHKRYILYNIYNSLDNTKKLYTINNMIDIMKDTEIVLAEGVFDIIGIYNNIYLGDDKQRVFCSINGSGYYSVIMYLLKLGIIHSDLHIYSDKDVKLEYYYRLKQKLKNRFFGDIYVYYNTKGKDYGVTVDKIKLKEYEI